MVSQGQYRNIFKVLRYVVIILQQILYSDQQRNNFDGDRQNVAASDLLTDKFTNVAVHTMRLLVTGLNDSTVTPVDESKIHSCSLRFIDLLVQPLISAVSYPVGSNQCLTHNQPTIITTRKQDNKGPYTGWPKKVSHYQVSSLNRIKNRH